MHCYYFIMFFPGKGWDPSFGEAKRISFSQGWFVPSLVEIGLLILEKKFFKFGNVFLLFCYYLPFEEGITLFLKTNFNPLYPRIRCAKFDWNWLSGSREEDKKCERFTITTTTSSTTNHNEQVSAEKLTWAFDSGELKCDDVTCSTLDKNILCICKYVCTIDSVTIAITIYPFCFPLSMIQ